MDYIARPTARTRAKTLLHTRTLSPALVHHILSRCNIRFLFHWRNRFPLDTRTHVTNTIARDKIPTPSIYLQVNLLWKLGSITFELNHKVLNQRWPDAWYGRNTAYIHANFHWVAVLKLRNFYWFYLLNLVFLFLPVSKLLYGLKHYNLFRSVLRLIVRVKMTGTLR